MEIVFLGAVFVLSWILVGRFRKYALTKGLLDNPNARSSHTLPTPRGGGMVFVVLWLAVGTGAVFFDVWSIGQALVFLPGALLISLIGYWDDHQHLSVRWRALAHLVGAGAAMLVLGGMSAVDVGAMPIQWGWLGTLLAVIAIVWSVNLFNFMDGTDGIAGVEALFVFGVGGWLLWQAGGASQAMMVWALAAAVAGFLVWNWPRARIFMGDGGSGFLGFLIAAFAIAGEVWFGVPALLWVILYGVFWFDATVTLVRRIARGEQWYAAHRSHAYQRLHHGMGWTHARVLGGVIVLNSVLTVIVMWGYAHREMMLWALMAALTILAIAYAAVERGAAMYPAGEGK